MEDVDADDSGHIVGYSENKKFPVVDVISPLLSLTYFLRRSNAELQQIDFAENTEISLLNDWANLCRTGDKFAL
jgi:hypothetical protein